MLYPALPPEPPALTLAQTNSSITASLPEGGTVIAASTDCKEGETSSTPIHSQEQTVTLTFPAATPSAPTSQLPSPLHPLTPSFPTIPALAQQSTPSPELGGSPPSLQTQPSTPEQQPFQPKNPPFPQLYPIAPSITVVTPSAYGKSEGSAAIGFGLQTPSDYSSDVEGGVGVSVGLGDARQAVGLDIGVSVSVTSEQFAERATLSAKLHRQLPEDFAIAVGVRNTINLDSDKISSDKEEEVSVYGVVTKQFRLRPYQTDAFSRLYLSVGVGGGQFRKQSDQEDDANSIGVFGSVAVQVAQPVNAIAEWTGQDLILGLSWTPIPHVPLVITPAVDATGNAAGENRFLLGIGYGFSF